MTDKEMDIPNTITYVLKTAGRKAAQAIVDGLTGPLRDQAAQSVANYRGDIAKEVPSNVERVETSAEGRVKPTNNSENITYAGRPATQNSVGAQVPAGQYSYGRPAETFAAGENATLSSNSQVGVGDEGKDLREDSDEGLTEDEERIMYRNRYGSEYGTDERIQRIFKTKDGFESDAMLEATSEKMLAKSYKAATGDTFSGSREDLLAMMKSLRDQAKDTYTKPKNLFWD